MSSIFFKHLIAFPPMDQYPSQKVCGFPQNVMLFVPDTWTFSTAALTAIDSGIPVITEGFLFIQNTQYMLSPP